MWVDHLLPILEASRDLIFLVLFYFPVAIVDIVVLFWLDYFVVVVDCVS